MTVNGRTTMKTNSSKLADFCPLGFSAGRKIQVIAEFCRTKFGSFGKEMWDPYVVGKIQMQPGLAVTSRKYKPGRTKPGNIARQNVKFQAFHAPPIITVFDFDISTTAKI